MRPCVCVYALHMDNNEFRLIYYSIGDFIDGKLVYK